MLTRFRRRLEGTRRQVQTFREDLESPLPQVKLAQGRSMSAWLVRLTLVIFGVVTILALQPGVPPILLLSAFLLGVAIQPGAFSGCLYCIALAVIWLALPTPAVSIQTVLLIGFGSAIPALATVVDRLPLRTRIEFRAFVPSLLRFAIVQAVSQPLVLAAGSLANLRLGVLPVAVAAVVIVAVAAWLLLPRLSD